MPSEMMKTVTSAFGYKVSSCNYSELKLSKRVLCLFR